MRRSVGGAKEAGGFGLLRAGAHVVRAATEIAGILIAFIGLRAFVGPVASCATAPTVAIARGFRGRFGAGRAFGAPMAELAAVWTWTVAGSGPALAGEAAGAAIAAIRGLGGGGAQE